MPGDWLSNYQNEQSFQNFASLDPALGKKGEVVWDEKSQQVAGIFSEAMEAKALIKDHPEYKNGYSGKAKADLHVDAIVKRMNEDIETLEKDLTSLLFKPDHSFMQVQGKQARLAALLTDLKAKSAMLSQGAFNNLDGVQKLNEEITRLEQINNALISETIKLKTTPSEVSQLMSLSEGEWKERSTDALNEKMRLYSAQCVPEGRTIEATGFLEKHDLDPGARIAVIGDIHGNDLRLELTLKSLQKKGFLDEQFRCMPGKRVVFLGDYVDRGKNTLKVLELLMTLKMENPEQVHLIRGNHEDLATSAGSLDRYAALDPKYRSYMREQKNLDAISSFYESLPVAIYMGQKSADKKEEYVQFCHGLFHLYTDPAPLLESKEPNAHQWVNGSPGFSHRVQQIMVEKPIESDRDQKLRKAAEKLMELQSKMPVKFDDIYWLDAGITFHADIASGRTQIPPDMVKAYLQVSGTESKRIKEIMRGHQNGICTIRGAKQEVLVTTLDPSADEEHQTFMMMSVAPKVSNWIKAFLVMPLDPMQNVALEALEEIHEE